MACLPVVGEHMKELGHYLLRCDSVKQRIPSWTESDALLNKNTVNHSSFIVSGSSIEGALSDAVILSTSVPKATAAVEEAS